MNWDHLDQKSLNEHLIRALAKVSLVDDFLSRDELSYIIKVGRSLGIDSESITHLCKEASDTDLPVPKAERDRMGIIYYLIFAIHSDGEVTKEEENIIYHFGLKLGFNHLMITDFLDKIKANLLDRDQPVNLLDEVKKYLN